MSLAFRFLGVGLNFTIHASAIRLGFWGSCSFLDSGIQGMEWLVGADALQIL